MMMVENVYGHDDDNNVRMMFGFKPEDANAWVSSEPVLGRISKKNCPADIKTSRSKILDLDSTNSNFVRCVEVRSWSCSGRQSVPWVVTSGAQHSRSHWNLLYTIQQRELK